MAPARPRLETRSDTRRSCVSSATRFGDGAGSYLDCDAEAVAYEDECAELESLAGRGGCWESFDAYLGCMSALDCKTFSTQEDE